MQGPLEVSPGPGARGEVILGSRSKGGQAKNVCTKSVNVNVSCKANNSQSERVNF
jgi:hypothetical protein